jgi:hypothetical protein
VAIWGYLKLKKPDQLVFIGFAKQEGDKAQGRNHAEARWQAEHLVRMASLLSQHKQRVVQVEFDLTKDPCIQYCRPEVFPAIRGVCTANLDDQGLTPIYIFLDVDGKRLAFDHFVEVSPTGAVSSPPRPDS